MSSPVGKCSFNKEEIINKREISLFSVHELDSGVHDLP
jgi:hypothetical protein